MATFIDYGILTGYWIMFCVLHHITAMEKCKNWFIFKMGTGFRYYRLIYSSIATVTLIIVLWRQFSVKSIDLGISIVIKYFVALPLGMTGFCLMCITIRKYFFKLSGISVFYRKAHSTSLELYGIHKYIRHPLYLGSLMFAWALMLFFSLMSGLIACIVITIYLVIGIKSEEKKLMIIFGETYKNYRDKTPGLIPHIRIQITLLP